MGEDFADDLFEDSRSECEQMTQTQKRKNAQHYLQKVAGLTMTDMVKEQQEDPEMQRWKKQEDPTRVIERNGILL